MTQDARSGLIPLSGKAMSRPRRIVLLGSTGSIGTQTLDVISRNPESCELLALAAHSNETVLAEQVRRFRPRYIGIVDQSAATRLRALLTGVKVEILVGISSLSELASLADADIIVNAVVGSAGLTASLETVRHGKILALANKESLVAGGPLFAPICQQTGAVIHPIDSEHSALWQALQGNDPVNIKSLILTASGGPFRTLSAEQLQDVTVEDALSHPTWRMGPKVTIDSATLANKGLEIIEAVMLFGLPRKKVQVVVHPQSIVHSMIEFADSSVMAQLSTPDMRLPISYALSYPDRWNAEPGTIEWSTLSTLTFEPPDPIRFPCLQHAMDAADELGTAPAIFNAANETAVASFLERSISFVQIPEVIARVREQMTVEKVQSVEEITFADQQSRQIARIVIEKLP